MKTRMMDDASVWLRDTLFIAGGGETGGDWQIRPDGPGYRRSWRYLYITLLQSPNYASFRCFYQIG
jgi:hypothetical protein